MKSLFFMLLILGQSMNSFAGPISSGGGDAKVAEFLNIADEICHWSLNQRLETAYSSISSCTKVIEDLKGSLDQSIAPKVAFTNSQLYDGGVSKVAIFDRKSGRILVNRTLWGRSSVIEKYVTVGIELSGFCGVEKRYEFGQKIAANFSALFEANAMTCKIKAVDPKSGVATELLPPTTKPIDRIYDHDFQTALIDSNNKAWNVWLLESAPSKFDSEISLSWAIRDSKGFPSAVENVAIGLPFVNGAQSSLKVLWSGLVIQASCGLQSKLK